MKYLMLFCLLVSGVFLGVAQRSSATLVDEFGNPNCEDLWARLDNFLIQINNNPDLVGTISFSGKVGDLQRDLYYENQMKLYFIRRQIPQSRWRIIRVKPRPSRTIQFWLTQPGETPKGVEFSQWSLVYPDGTKPFVFAWADSYPEDVCLTADEVGLLAEVLKANPDARTNVVLVVRTQQDYERRRKQTLRRLTSNYLIPKRQIRIFKDLRSKRYGIASDVQYWFVP